MFKINQRCSKLTIRVQNELEVFKIN